MTVTGGGSASPGFEVRAEVGPPLDGGRDQATPGVSAMISCESALRPVSPNAATRVARDRRDR